MPQKRCQGGRRLHCRRPQSVFEEDEAEEAPKKNVKKIFKKNIGQNFFFEEDKAEEAAESSSSKC